MSILIVAIIVVVIFFALSINAKNDNKLPNGCMVMLVIILAIGMIILLAYNCSNSFHNNVFDNPHWDGN